MTKAEMMMHLLKLQSEIDIEAMLLFGGFLKKAVESGDPKEFLKGVLRAVVEAPESETQVQTVSVKILPKKAGR